jgi:hypothetical protein
MIRSNYIFETTSGIANYLNDLEVFLNSTPSATDIEGMFTYLGEMRAHYGTLAHVIGLTKVQRATLIAGIVDKTEKEVYSRIKNSSTLVVEYAESKDQNTAFIYHKAEFMKRALQDATSQITTMIAFRKEELRLSGSGVKQN